MLKKLRSKAGQLKNKISSNKDYRELLVDSSLAFSIRLGAAIAAFIMNVVVARYLGIDASGLFFLSLSIITIVSTVVRFGADNVVLRFVGIYSEESKWNFVRGIVYSVSAVILAISVTVTILILIFAKDISVLLFKKIELESPLFWISISIPCIAVSAIIAMALQGIKKVLYSVSVQNVFTPLFLILLILILRPHTAGKVSLLYFISAFITLLLSIIFWFVFVPAGARKFDSRLIFSNCTPLWIVTITQQAIQWGGQFIAGIYCQPKIIGELAVAQRTSMLISFILVAINLVSAPKFANLYKQGKINELKRYSKNTTWLMIFFATPILIFICVFPHFILSIFGKGFTEGISMLIIMSFGQYVNVISGAVGYLLVMSGHGKELRNITILSGVISVILNLVLIKFYGGLGAAIAIAVGVGIQNILAIGMVEKKLGFNTLKILTLRTIKKDK